MPKNTRSSSHTVAGEEPWERFRHFADAREPLREWKCEGCDTWFSAPDAARPQTIHYRKEQPSTAWCALCMPEDPWLKRFGRGAVMVGVPGIPHKAPSVPTRPSANARETRSTQPQEIATAPKTPSVAGAMRDVLSAAASASAFTIESARDLIHYMFRRGQIEQEEAEVLIQQAEAAYVAKHGALPVRGSTAPQPKPVPHGKEPNVTECRLELPLRLDTQAAVFDRFVIYDAHSRVVCEMDDYDEAAKYVSAANGVEIGEVHEEVARQGQMYAEYMRNLKGNIRPAS